MNDTFGQNSAHHIRLLVDHVPSMLAYWDRDLRCRFANQAYVRWFGVDADRLVGTSIRDLLGPDLFAANEPYIRAALNGQPQEFERVVPGPDGVRRHSLAVYIPDIVDGEVMGFIAHVTEVTKLKETEAALRLQIGERERAYALLRESEKALREAQRVGQIGSWSWEAGTDITVWSEELYHLFGRDPSQLPPLLAQHSRLYTPASWARLDAAIGHALRTGEPYVLELEYVRADGQTGWLEARGEVTRDEQGAVCGVRGTVLEISRRRAQEQDRTRMQVLEAASHNKNTMMSRVSHELRTPLNGIMGFAQLCEGDLSLSPKHRQWAKHILASGEHMLALVDEVLDLSTAESGDLVVTNREMDLMTVVQAALTQASPLAESSGIRLVRPDAQACVPLKSDAKRLRQVADNLLSNAIKYTAAGGEVVVSVRQLPGAVELSVADTGQGLTEQQIERLYTPFERLGAEKTSVAGTGVGLALTKAIVERLGGSITVTSVAGVGTTFTVRVPSVPAT
ncbi:MAG: ATP-binding protein [Burkholderiales bacterium]